MFLLRKAPPGETSSAVTSSSVPRRDRRTPRPPRGEGPTLRVTGTAFPPPWARPSPLSALCRGKCATRRSWWCLRGEDRPEETGDQKKEKGILKRLICWRDWEGNPFSGDFPAAGIIFPQVMQWAVSAGRRPPSGSQPLRLRWSPRPPPSAAEN